MVIQAVKNATMWVVIGVILNLVFEPVALMFHHPLDGLFGLVYNISQAPDVIGAALVSSALIAVIWLLLILFFLVLARVMKSGGNNNGYK